LDLQAVESATVIRAAMRGEVALGGGLRNS